jgi:putative transposase
MARLSHDNETITESQETFEQMVRERLRQAVRLTLMSVLEEEVTAIIGAERYERSERRRDQRNGHYQRALETTVGKIEDLVVPRTRQGYQTQVFERYHRRQAKVDDAMSEMFVAGASQARVGEVMETLTGSAPSPSSVSRVFHTLESEYEQWKSRQLAERYEYAFADGTYFTGIYNGEGCKMPILTVVGIAVTGEREVLGFRVGDRENQQARARPVSRFEAARCQGGGIGRRVMAIRLR